MKLLERKIALNQWGTVKIIPQRPDDLWILYNLIAVGDVITTQTSRKVHLTSVSGKNTNPIRIRVSLEIQVAAVDYDGHAAAIRIRGKNRLGTENVTVGSFHTVELERDKEFTLEKKAWDKQAVEALEEGRNGKSGYDLAVVLIGEGSGRLYLIGESGTKLCSKIEEERSNAKTGRNKFFESVSGAFTKHIDLNTVRCAVIGSSGAIKEEFRTYLLSESRKSKLKAIENNKSRIILVNTKRENNDNLREVLNDKTVMNMINNTKITIEIRAMNELIDMISRDSDRVCYGLRSVEIAHELAAIETLLVTDELFRSTEVGTRKKYMELVRSVKEAGGKVMVVSPSWSEELAKLTGVAAILRFPVPQIDDLVL